jgi:hypothetical protein
LVYRNLSWGEAVALAKPEDVARATKQLAGVRVLVGIPSDSKERALTLPQEAQNMFSGATSKPVSNALLGYVHEFGSPAQNIPARPFLIPGVKNSRSKWERYLRQAATAALEGNDGVMDRALNAAGQIARDAVAATITAGIPPPIKPATMAARARHRGGGADRAEARSAYRGFHERYEAGIETEVTGGGVTPLIDTSQLINSITFVVRKK